MNLFTYGSLTFPEIVETLTARTFESLEVQVNGFERRALIGKRYPGLIDSPAGVVSGRLYLGIDEESAALLDAFEDELYDRRILFVETPQLGTITALAYVVPPDQIHRVSQSVWDIDNFRREHLASYGAMCSEFRKQFLARQASATVK